MNIKARFTPDLRRMSQAVRRLRRKPTYVLRCLGVLGMLAGLLNAAAGGPAAVTITGLVAGLVLVVEMDVVIWLRLRRNKEMIAQPVAITLTDEGINRVSPTTSANFTWDMVQRVIDERDFWIFVVNPLQAVMLPKAILSPHQGSELAGFLAAGDPVRKAGTDADALHVLRPPEAEVKTSVRKPSMNSGIPQADGKSARWAVGGSTPEAARSQAVVYASVCRNFEARPPGERGEHCARAEL